MKHNLRTVTIITCQ